MKRFFLISTAFILTSSAFAQTKTKCITAHVSVTGSQTTITTSGAKSVTENQAYIYYASKHRKRHMRESSVAGINDRYHSKPLMLSSGKDVRAIPEVYNVSLNTPQSTVSVCPDSTLNVAANINLEKVSSYTGNYPNAASDSKTYRKVSKRDYKMAARKMRKIERKEQKIARKTGTTVNVKSNRTA